MMRKLFPILALAILALALPAPASADSVCASGSTCTVLLTSSNVVQLAGAVVTVTIDNTGANTVLSFQLTTNPLTNTPLGIDQLGWNALQVQIGTKKQGKITVPVFGPNPKALSTSSTNYGGNQGVNPNGNGNLDGFGNFDINANNPGGKTGISAATKISFTLGGLITNFPTNLGGNDFAVHVRFGGSCSGWIGGLGGSSNPTSDTNCTPIPPPPHNPVPEPGSLALLGTGLVGVAGMIRRRFAK